MAAVGSSVGPEGGKSLDAATISRMWRTARRRCRCPPRPSSGSSPPPADPAESLAGLAHRRRRGASNPNLSTWLVSSAGVRASDSSMKSIESDWTWASTNGRIRPWPSRESKPVLDLLDPRVGHAGHTAVPANVGGTRSRAMTAQAPRPRQFSPGRVDHVHDQRRPSASLPAGLYSKVASSTIPSHRERRPSKVRSNAGDAGGVLTNRLLQLCKARIRSLCSSSLSERRRRPRREPAPSGRYSTAGRMGCWMRRLMSAFLTRVGRLQSAIPLGSGRRGGPTAGGRAAHAKAS